MTKRKNETDSRRKYFQGTNFNKIILQFSSAQSRNATKSTFVHWQIWFNSDTPEKIRWILKVANWSREITPLSQISVMRHLGLLVAWCNAEKVMFTWSTVRLSDPGAPLASVCQHSQRAGREQWPSYVKKVFTEMFCVLEVHQANILYHMVNIGGIVVWLRWHKIRGLL